MEQVLRIFLGFLADYVLAFLKNFRAARLDNPKLWEVAEMVITQINVAHPDWSGEQKRAYAVEAIKVTAAELFKDAEHAAVQSLIPSDSQVNTMTELIVQKLKAASAQ